MNGGTAAACNKERTAPPLVIAALRAVAAVFAATVYVMAPLPFPEAPAVTEIQFALLTLVQPHPEATVI